MPLFNQDTNFPLIQLADSADWDELPALCQNLMTTGALAQVRDYLSSSAKSIVVERDYIDKDYRDTFSNFYSKKFAEYPSRTIRLHFFRCVLEPEAMWSLKDYEGDYIGSMVIRPTRINAVGRTLLDPGKIQSKRGAMCLAEYKVNLLGSQLSVSAFPYLSQDTDVTVCAHASCWMVFRYFSERYPRYAEVWPYEITQLTTDYSHGRLVPSGGLTVGQIAEIFSRYGFFPLVYFRDSFESLYAHDKEFFDRLLYHYVESGIPVVACLLDKQHALTVFGHVSDYSRTLPVGDYVDSYGYVTGFVVNDDNHLPYQVLPQSNSVGPQHPDGYTISDIGAFVVPLYEKMHLFAEHIEKWTRFILSSHHIGLAATGSSLLPKDIVLRIFLTNSTSYKRISRSERNPPLPHGLEKFYVFRSMPHFIWVAELSTRDSYPKGHILGEIIWDSTASGHDIYSFTSIHYPDLLVINDRHSLSQGFDRLIVNKYPGPVPYEVYRHNLREVT